MVEILICLFTVTFSLLFPVTLGHVYVQCHRLFPYLIAVHSSRAFIRNSFDLFLPNKLFNLLREKLKADGMV